jgi:excisionase family DNA binding protein
MTKHAVGAPQRVRDDQASARGTLRLGPQRGKRDADDEEEMSRTGELVISLQGQVETLTAAVRTLARQIPPPLVSVHEAAVRLGVSVNTVRRRVKSGEIPCTRIGKALRIDLSKVRVLDQEEVEEMAQRAMAR